MAALAKYKLKLVHTGRHYILHKKVTNSSKLENGEKYSQRSSGYGSLICCHQCHGRLLYAKGLAKTNKKAPQDSDEDHEDQEEGASPSLSFIGKSASQIKKT